MRTSILVRTAVAGLCASVLAITPTLTSGPAGATTRAADQAVSQTITAKIARDDSVTLRGTAGLSAGRANLVVTGHGHTNLSLITLAKGYTWPEFAKDLKAGFQRNDAKAVKRLYARTDAIGGLSPGETGSVFFPHAGTYYAFTFGEKLSNVVTFKVGAMKRKSATPHVDAKIVAKDGPGWGGSSQLPAQGRLLFKNTATTPVLHFLEMQEVVEGTTVEEVLATFQGPELQGPPPWALHASLQADVISPGRSMTVDYDLPPGQYVLLCFMPDPKMHGMPHALMGMIKMVHLS